MKKTKTNKQTNKHFLIDNISAKSCPIFTKLSENFPWGYPKIIQIKDKKQTNKHV